MKHHYVYVLRANGLYKIGRTRNPEHRVRQLQTGSPYPLEIVGLIKTRHHGLERALHRRYAPAQQLGEWYALTPADIEWIQY